MLKSHAFGVIAGLVLAGCASSQEKAMSACDGYGFTRGTAEYASCIQTERLAEEQRRASLRAAGAAMLNSQPQRPQSPTQTQCIQQGVYVNCQTY
jgi:hypothetical protein